jgi:hypothetical protein
MSSQSLLIIEMHAEKNATTKYNLLKTEYNTLFITTFSTLYKKIFKCFITNHKDIRKDDHEITHSRNKLKELDKSINKLIVTCCFLDELNSEC